MATKMFNVKRPMQFVRPDGTTCSLQPGLQEIDATPYKGADGKAAGVDNAKSDAEHWFLNQPENAEIVQTKAEKDAAAAAADAAGKDGGTPNAPASGEAKGTAATGAGSTPATNPAAK